MVIPPPVRAEKLVCNRPCFEYKNSHHMRFSRRANAVECWFPTLEKIWGDAVKRFWMFLLDSGKHIQKRLTSLPLGFSGPHLWYSISLIKFLNISMVFKSEIAWLLQKPRLTVLWKRSMAFARERSNKVGASIFRCYLRLILVLYSWQIFVRQYLMELGSYIVVWR